MASYVISFTDDEKDLRIVTKDGDSYISVVENSAGMGVYERKVYANGTYTDFKTLYPWHRIKAVSSVAVQGK